MIRLATEKDKQAVRDLWYACFHDTENYMDLWFSEFYPRAKTLVCKEDGKIQGALQMLPVTFCIEGEKYSGYYIGGVSVREEFRHEKIGSRLMEEAEEVAREDGMDFCILISDVVGYYERFGYEPLSYRVTLSPDETVFLLHEYLFVPMRAEDAEDVLLVYQTFTQGKTAYQLRTANEMERMLRLEQASNGGVTLVYRLGDLLAYVAYDAWGDTLYADEAAWISEEGKEGVLAFLQTFGKKEISIRCGEEFSEERGNPSVMVRVLCDISLPKGGSYCITL